MTKICSKCNKDAVSFIRYNGTHLCRDHFIQYFDRRVKKNIKKQGKTVDNKLIGIALSGGKDSTVALNVANDIFSKMKKVDLYAITIDEGIEGYRNESIKYAIENCNILGIEHHIVSFKDMIGMTMDEIALKQDEFGECSYCGVFRRLCLNKKSKELEIDKLVTGHNLDDMAQSILMNFVNGDIKKLSRLGPHKKIHRGLVPRMFPLSVIPEKEVALYALLKNIEYHHGECYYSTHAYRGIFRDIIDDLEYRNPGTKHSIISSYDSVKDILIDKINPLELNICLKCGEPTSQNLCKACLMKDMIL